MSCAVEAAASACVGHRVVEIAIIPGDVWLAARSLRARCVSYRTAV
jgi:hypothetical protein